MKKIKTIFLDVDGTLTDGKVYYDASGNEMKAFHVQDGLILAAMVRQGYRFVVITGRKSEIVTRRMSELGITDVYQGIADKKEFIKEFLLQNAITEDSCGYIGDDLNDLEAMRMVAWAACPANACREVRDIAITASKEGGNGAVRELLEQLLEQNAVVKNQPPR